MPAMKYPFVPFPQRKPLRWPNGKRLAVMITTNLEYWDATKDTPKPFYPGGPGIVGGDLPGNVYDNPNYTWREYGQRVGVWRMFDLFDRFGVLGYVFERVGFPVAPLVLGVILGPIAEENFMNSMISFSNDWTVFFTRPISGSIVAFTVLVLLLPMFQRMIAKHRARGS
jgi:hypothetical protein